MKNWGSTVGSVSTYTAGVSRWSVPVVAAGESVGRGRERQQTYSPIMLKGQGNGGPSMENAQEARQPGMWMVCEAKGKNTEELGSKRS